MISDRKQKSMKKAIGDKISAKHWKIHSHFLFFIHTKVKDCSPRTDKQFSDHLKQQVIAAKAEFGIPYFS